MKKQIMLSVIFAGLFLSSMTTHSIEAVGEKRKEENSAKEWLKKNATHDMKKMIANLRIENELSSLKLRTFSIVPNNTPEWKMFNTLPDFVQNYYINGKFNSIIFEAKDFSFEAKGEKCLELIKVYVFKNNKPTKKDIDNFDSDNYKFAKYFD